MPFAALGLEFLAPHKSIQVDEGGEWENELWTELRPDRRIKLLFQCVGAHPKVVGRRNGIAHRIYNRLRSDDRFPGEQILAEVQWCLNTLISEGGFSTYQMVFGSNPVDPCGRGDKDEESVSTQDPSLSGQVAQQRGLRTMALVAALTSTVVGVQRVLHVRG